MIPLHRAGGVDSDPVADLVHIQDEFGSGADPDELIVLSRLDRDQGRRAHRDGYSRDAGSYTRSRRLYRHRHQADGGDSRRSVRLWSGAAPSRGCRHDGITADRRSRRQPRTGGYIAVNATMDVVQLSRLQFGLTAMYHFLFIPLTLGLAVLLGDHGERLCHDRVARSGGG